MKKILVVEDEIAYVSLLQDKLSANGFKVLTAEDGKKGLQMATKNKPDLIILDVRMPVMDGMTMLDLLRKDHYGEKAKVIILTNLEPSDKIIKNVIDNQPTYYFVKSDTQLNDLLAKVKELLAEK